MSELYYSLMDAYKQIALMQGNNDAADEIQKIIDEHDAATREINESLEDKFLELFE